jgi:hypothetical protein
MCFLNRNGISKQNRSWKWVNPGADFDVCNKKKYFKSLSLNYAFLAKCLSRYVIKFTIHCNNELYICKLLTNYMFWSIFCLKEWVQVNILNHVILTIYRVYVWFKDDKHVIWIGIWLILINISLLVRLICFYINQFTSR